jgi:hypothetical protein
MTRLTPRPFTPREKPPGGHWTGGWVGPRAGIDTEARGKILCLCRDRIPAPNSSSLQPDTVLTELPHPVRELQTVHNWKTAIPFQIRGYVLEINAVDKSKVFSSRKPGFAPRSVNMRFVMNKVALGQFFSEFFGFPRQYHSTVDHHTHISSGRWTTGPLEDAVQRHSLTTPTWTTTRPRSGKRFFFPEGGVGLVPKRACLLTLAYYAFPR